MKRSTRILSLLLTVIMLFGMFSVTAFAQEAEKYEVRYYDGSEYLRKSTFDAGAAVTIKDASKDGYTLVGWATSNGGSVAYEAGESVTFEDARTDLYAVWEENAPACTHVAQKLADPEYLVPGSTNEYYQSCKDCGEALTGKPTFVVDAADEDDNDTNVSGKPAAPKVGTKFSNAIRLNCTERNNHDVSLDWKVTKTYTVKWSSKYDAWYIKAPVYDCQKYVAEYNFYTFFVTDVHYCITNTAYVTLMWNDARDKWYVFDEAEIRMSCDEEYEDEQPWCGNHKKHTVTYTDGVLNERVFADKVYTVRHGDKTPTVKDPKREGYRFVGWSPEVNKYTYKCVTYKAMWVPEGEYVDAKLTTEHVAYVTGFSGSIRPNETITRAEVASMLYNLLDKKTLREYESTTNFFSDVPSSAWYNKAVSTLANAGVMNGYGAGKFAPNAYITRAELVTVLSAFADSTYAPACRFTDAKNHWAADAIALADYLGWVKGYGQNTFRPDNNVTRAEAIAIINRMLGRTGCNVEDTVKFSDNSPSAPTAWYYKDIVEATVAH